MAQGDYTAKYGLINLCSMVSTYLYPLESLEQITQGTSISGITHLLDEHFQVYTPGGSSYKYAVSWMTLHDSDLGKKGGGHLFICSHSIKVVAATNTVIVWKLRSWYGTSLQHWDPNVP